MTESSTTIETTIDPAYAAQNNFHRMMAINGTFLGLAIASVVMRVYTRAVIVKSFGKDDALMILTLLLLLVGGMVSQIIAGTRGALGRHYDVVTKDEWHIYLEMSFIQGVVMTVTSICCLKISIALSLLRLSTIKFYTYIIRGLVGFICTYMIMGWVSLLAHCQPIEGEWNSDIEATCYPTATLNALASTNTVLNIFTDIAFATLPIPLIWPLKMRLQTRIYLIGIFSLGYFAVIIGIVKLVLQLTTRGQPDKSFNNWIQFFGLLQQSVGIIAACCPMLKPIFARTLKLSSHDRTGPSSYFKSKPMGPNQRQSARGYMRSEVGEFEMGALEGRFPGSSNFHTSIEGGGSRSGSDDIAFGATGRVISVMKVTEVNVH